MFKNRSDVEGTYYMSEYLNRVPSLVKCSLWTAFSFDTAIGLS